MLNGVSFRLADLIKLQLFEGKGSSIFRSNSNDRRRPIFLKILHGINDCAKDGG